MSKYILGILAYFQKFTTINNQLTSTFTNYACAMTFISTNKQDNQPILYLYKQPLVSIARITAEPAGIRQYLDARPL